VNVLIMGAGADVMAAAKDAKVFAQGGVARLRGRAVDRTENLG
jgi:hypothetical protein